MPQTLNAQQKHRKPSRGWRSTSKIRIGIEFILKKPISKESLVALFDGRASYSAIKSWRFGQCAPPQWAVDLLRHKLEADMRQEIDAQIKTAAGPGSGGTSGKLSLGRWRATPKL